VKPSRKRARVSIEYHDENANKKLANALATKEITRTYLVLNNAIVGETTRVARASPKLTALERRAISP
jgi:hypothetical protein